MQIAVNECPYVICYTSVEGEVKRKRARRCSGGFLNVERKNSELFDITRNLLRDRLPSSRSSFLPKNLTNLLARPVRKKRSLHNAKSEEQEWSYSEEEEGVKAVEKLNGIIHSRNLNFLTRFKSGHT